MHEGTTGPNTDLIRLEPVGRYKKTQNGNARLQGTNHTASSRINNSISQSSPLINNACDTGGGGGGGVGGGNESPVCAKKTVYANSGIAVCSHNKALCIAAIVFLLLFTIALIVAFTGPQSECTCAGEKPPNFVDDNWNASKDIKPLSTNGQIFPWNNIRLPTFIRPIRYNITIHPNLTTLEVKGQVSIEFHVEKDTHFLVLHSKNLTINDKIVHDHAGINVHVTRMLEYTGAQQLYLEVRDRFRKKHNYTLMIRFTYKLNQDYEGFYISSYNAKDNETRYLATTHFEPTYARAAFPCFDEPHFKAKFKVSIFRDRFHIALFNMPVINTEDVGFYMGTGLLRDDFQESLEMSTYLVAFVICDYTNINRRTAKGVSISMYAPGPYMTQAAFALNVSVNILDFFENFFGMPHPLPKLDMACIPESPEAAMENWGLITYRDTSVLYNPRVTATKAHQHVAVTIAHQISQQWFGNLVSMKWWNELWLYEAFATLFEYLGVDNFYPEWKMLDQFVLDQTQPALALDALSSSHAISVIVSNPDEIDAIFDTISYSKGVAILYMLSRFLQNDELQNGLNDFLNTYKYSNADAENLWNLFSQSTNNTLNVKTIMETWTNQMGFPLITITREEHEAKATQQRFLVTVDGMNSSVSSLPKSKFDYKWYVPLSYITSNDTQTVNNIWMNLSDVRFELDQNISWIKANVNQSGFYRVMYDEHNWKNLIAVLRTNHTIFSPSDRASLIDDAFTLCRAGLLNASVPLELSLYLSQEREYVPWATAIEHLQSWSRRLSESLAYKLFLQYLRKLLQPVAQYVGWSDRGTHLEKLMRTQILTAAILCELNDTVTQAKYEFQKWMIRNETIKSDLKDIVYTAGIKFGSTPEWHHCWRLYNITNDPSERRLLLKALGAASDPWLLQRYLLETLDRNVVEPQDVKIILSVVAANPEGRLLAWRHLKAYWPTMHSFFGNATFMMGSLISAVTAHLTTPYDYYEVSTYFNGMSVGSAARALEQSLETIKLNINWISKNEEDIYSWLKKYVK